MTYLKHSLLSFFLISLCLIMTSQRNSERIRKLFTSWSKTPKRWFWTLDQDDNSFYLTSKLANSEICWIFKCLFFYPLREAVSNFLTALSLQRKSRNQQQVPHPAISGNIWAALRIALSLMDQPELFQAANLGDLDVLLRAFNLDPWRKRGKKILHLCNCTEKCKTILLWIPKKG